MIARERPASSFHCLSFQLYASTVSQSDIPRAPSKEIRLQCRKILGLIRPLGNHPCVAQRNMGCVHKVTGIGHDKTFGLACAWIMSAYWVGFFYINKRFSSLSTVWSHSHIIHICVNININIHILFILIFTYYSYVYKYILNYLTRSAVQLLSLQSDLYSQSSNSVWVGTLYLEETFLCSQDFYDRIAGLLYFIICNIFNLFRLYLLSVQHIMKCLSLISFLNRNQQKTIRSPFFRFQLFWFHLISFQFFLLFSVNQHKAFKS